MNEVAAGFTAACALALILLPRRWAVVPLLAAASYMTAAQRIELGPISFTVLRLLVLAGVIRVIVRGERPAGSANRLDALILAWGVWALVSSVFHDNNPTSFFVTQAGTVYNVWGIYFLIRVFCSSVDDLKRLVQATAIVLMPVALEMVYEQAASRNLFAIFGGIPPVPVLREGRIRANGPFAHSILAGTVGGVMLAPMVGIWATRRFTSLLGMAVCLTMVFASASSGPLSTALVAVVGLGLWRFRAYTRMFRWMIVGAYCALLVLMTRPPYYIIQRFEFVGGSTGWYRSRLIESSLEHLNEWWLFGTDVTRHWMPSNQHELNPNHIDITNHYLTMGVNGGLLLMLLHIAILVVAFKYVGRSVKSAEGAGDQAYVYWSLGVAMLAHTVTGISVSYFDQSFLFLYLTLAAIASVHALPAVATATGAPLSATPGDNRRYNAEWAQAVGGGVPRRPAAFASLRRPERR